MRASAGRWGGTAGPQRSAIRATDPITAITDLDLKITAYELQSSEILADTVKREVLLHGLALLAEVQKHFMKIQQD